MRKLTTNYDTVQASEPVDGNARSVVRRAERYVPDKAITQAHWEAPPPTKPAPRNAPDLTGRSVGQFKVVGYLGPRKSRGALWLVRCGCGRYETRLARSITNPNNTADCCDECRHVIFLRRRSERDRHAKGD